MRFYYLPKGEYKIGQLVEVGGHRMRVESYSHTGKNLIATTIQGAPRFIRAAVILTAAAPIEGVPA